jgi:hypothetical protein
MWRRVDLVWTDVSEEHIASIFKEETSESKEQAWAGGCRLCSFSRTFQHFIELEGSLPRSQEPSTGPYPEPDRSSP